VRLPLVLSVALRLLAREPRRRDGARLAATAVRLWLRDRLGRPQTPVAAAVTAPNGARVPLRLWSYIDVLVVRELFLDRDYRVPADLDVRSVLDLGSNTGISIRFFRALYRDARIVGVEPDPRLFARLRENTRALAGVSVQPVAASDRTGSARFFAAAEGWASSLSRPRGRADEIEVQCETVAGILAREGLDRVDLVKVDIEGGEWPLLESGQLQAVTDCIVGELHDGGPGRTVDDARRALGGWTLTVHAADGAVASFTAVRTAR
jgi:FkbM family methyltransferase